MSLSVFGKAKNINPAFDLPLRKSQGITEVRVTPEIAQHWLSFNTGNRVISQANLERYRLDMERGEWRVTGDTIRFSYGKLLDGQTRLSALVLSGATLPMIVVHGLDPEVQADMDTGRGRTPRDVLSMAGEGAWEAKTLGSALHTILAYESGLALYSTKKYLNREIRNFYLEHQTPLDASVQICKALPRRHALVPPARMLAMHYILAKKSRENADFFVKTLSSGEAISKTKHSPIFFLRERLLADLIDKRTRSAYEHFFYMARAWNSYRRGTVVRTQVFLYPSVGGDKFPEII